EVEPSAAEFGREREGAAGRLHDALLERPAVEGERVAQVRVPGKERFVGLVDDPGDAGVREPAPEAEEDGQRRAKVAQGAGLDRAIRRRSGLAGSIPPKPKPDAGGAGSRP